MGKPRILLLSDDLRMTSGISTMSREFVMGTLDRFNWVQLGAGINHHEAGKFVDVNEDARQKTGVKDAELKIIPYNSYGDIVMLRKILSEMKIDAILHFTDPHYWQWLYDSEHEIRQQVPILYYHIWDNLPDPMYNKDYYESCDWLGCISKLTYGIVNRVGKMEDEFRKPLQDWQISYVPHGINQDTFKPLEDKELIDIKKGLFGDKEYDFVLFFNSRIPADVAIGKGSVFAYRGMSTLLISGTEIGKDCFIAMRVTTGRNFPYKNVPKIGNKVWIGTNSVILGPVIIEDNVIIAPNSFVNKSVPANTIIGGNPARIIGSTLSLEYDIHENIQSKEGIMP